MREKFKVLSLSAGEFEDDSTREKRVFASLTYVDKEVANTIEDLQIRVGQQHTKIKISTENNNELAKSLALSGQIPGDVLLDLELRTIKNAPSLMVVGFQTNEQKILEPLGKK